MVQCTRCKVQRSGGGSGVVAVGKVAAEMASTRQDVPQLLHAVGWHYATLYSLPARQVHCRRLINSH